MQLAADAPVPWRFPIKGTRPMKKGPAPISSIDLLRRTAETWWRDFAPITLLALMLTTGTDLILYLIGAAHSPDPTTVTLATTARALAFVLFFSAVSAGTLLGGVRRLSPRTYILGGLKLAQPGLVAALLLAAMFFLVLIGELLLGMASRILARALSIAATGGILIVWLPAIPAAVAERLGPTAALRRAAALTRGRRWMLLGFTALVALVIVPPAVLLFYTVFGHALSAADVNQRMLEINPATIHYWVMELGDVLIRGFCAAALPTAYLALRSE